MLAAITALWKVRLSPTLMGIMGNLGPMPPASKTSSSSGAWSLWASMLATRGSPVPTNTDFLSQLGDAVHVFVQVLLDALIVPRHVEPLCHVVLVAVV